MGRIFGYLSVVFDLTVETLISAIRLFSLDFSSLSDNTRFTVPTKEKESPEFGCRGFLARMDSYVDFCNGFFGSNGKDE